jgi:hypothetical protein
MASQHSTGHVHVMRRHKNKREIKKGLVLLLVLFVVFLHCIAK